MGLWWLVGGLFLFYFSIYWEFHHPNWRSPWFFRGVGQPSNQHIVSHDFFPGFQRFLLPSRSRAWWSLVVGPTNGWTTSGRSTSLPLWGRPMPSPRPSDRKICSGTPPIFLLGKSMRSMVSLCFKRNTFRNETMRIHQRSILNYKNPW